MKHFKKLVSFLAILSCLTGSMAPLPAAASGRTAPRVTFTNQPNNSPDLYVTKRVTGGTQEQKYDQFQFVLKVGGEAAAGREYRLYELGDGGRKEIVRTDKNGNVIPFETDGSGVFWLEADWQAHFEVLGTGIRYEVEELTSYRTPKTDPQNGAVLEVPEKEKPYTLRYKGPVDEDDRETAPGQVLHKEYQYRLAALRQGGYSVTSPSGGKTGTLTMPAAGDAVQFSNRCTPVGAGETTVLNVHKTITFPENWKTPVTPDFRFRLEIDDAEYLPASYTASNQATGATRQGTTDDEGYFTLQGGWTAVFENVPAGVDYRLREITDSAGSPAPGWKAAGSSLWQGSTTAPEMNLDFNNSNLAFVVTKTLSDNQKPDVDFAFRLADGQNNGLAGKTFYLYRTTGEPVYLEDMEEEENTAQGNEAGPAANTEEGKTIVLRRTGTDGSFTLKPGQAAVFVDMEEGAVCQVTESSASGYVQMLPLPEDNEPINVRRSGEVQRVDFVNKALTADGTLTIQKRVTNPTGEGALTKKDFRFVLCRRLQTKAELAEALHLAEDADQAAVNKAVQEGLTSGSLTGAAAAEPSAGSGPAAGSSWETDYYYETGGGKYEIYVPLEGQMYSVPEGLNAPSYKTGPKADSNPELALGAGEFIIRDGQTAQFEGLDAGVRYLVREVRVPSEYREAVPAGSSESAEAPSYQRLYTEPGGEEAFAQTLTLTGDGAQAVFTNEYTPEKADLVLTKVSDSGKQLSGAEFMLYLERGREPANKVLPAALPDGVTAEDFCYATGADGTVAIPDLKLGTYWLYETRAPHTYSLLRDPIELTVERTGEGTLQVLINGVAYTQSAEIQNSTVSRVTLADRGEGQPKARIGLTVLNTELYDLPNSGGMGIYWYLISGVLLMMAAALILYRKNIRGRC